MEIKNLLLTLGLGIFISGCAHQRNIQVIAQGENSRYFSQTLGPNSIDVILENLNESEFTAGFGFNLDSTQHTILKEITAQGEDADYSKIINQTIYENEMRFNNHTDQITWLNELVVPLTVDYGILGPKHTPNSGVQNRVLERLLTSIEGIQLRTIQTVWGKIDGGTQWTEVRLPNGKAVIVNAGYGINDIQKSENYAKVKVRNADGSLEDLTEDYAEKLMNPKLSNGGLDPNREYYLGVLNHGQVISVDKSKTDRRGTIKFKDVGSGNVLYLITEDKGWFDTEGDPRIKNLFVLNGEKIETLNLGDNKNKSKYHNIRFDDKRFNNSFSYFDRENPENYSYRLLRLSNNGWISEGDIEYDNGFRVKIARGSAYAIEQVGKAITRPIRVVDKIATEH